MYGSIEAELEIQRTIKRAELVALVCLSKKVVGAIKVHVDNKGIIDGLRKGEKDCIKPRAGDIYMVREKETSWWKWNMCWRITPKRKRRICRSVRSLSPKAARRLMSRQKQEQCWMKDTWQKRELKLCSRRERRCMQHCSMRSASIAW